MCPCAEEPVNAVGEEPDEKSPSRNVPGASRMFGNLPFKWIVRK